MTRMSEASILNKVKEILEIIQEFSDEAEIYKDEGEFESGAAFAYRCVLNLFKEFGLDKGDN